MSVFETEVTITFNTDETGNASNPLYGVAYNPPQLPDLRLPNTVLSFYLSESSLPVVFTGCSARSDDSNLSGQCTKPLISVDGKKLVLIDVDTLDGDIELTLTWFDAERGLSFSCDPQVPNRGQPA